MAIDQIHDLQQVYRKLLHSMSRPGTITSIQTQAEEMDYGFSCNPATILSAMALLDAEVTFHVLSQKKQELIEKISEYTSARFAPADEADFIIVLKEDEEQAILQTMAECKIGSLIDPHQSATWIIESPFLTNEGKFRMTGPGIQTEARLRTDMPAAFWQERNKRIKEYPMGIDLVFADDAGQLACMPRTTSVITAEVE